MNVYEPRQSIRIASITDTRSWWQKTTLSRASWRLQVAGAAYGAFVGVAIKALVNG